MSPKNKIDQILETAGDVAEKMPKLPNVMDQATQALELFISGNSSQNYSPSISKSLELEKNRLKQEKNSFIIKVLVVVILGLLLFK